MDPDGTTQNDPFPTASDPLPTASDPLGFGQPYGSMTPPGAMGGPFPERTSWPPARRRTQPIKGPVGIAAAAIGLVVFAIIAATAFSGHGGGPASPGDAGSLSWGADAGDTISAGQFSEIGSAATEDSVRRTLGTPATVAHNPTDRITGDGQRCLGYRAATGTSLYLICFGADGRFVEKQTW